MIPRSVQWKNALAETIRDADTLAALVGVPLPRKEDACRAAAAFPVRVPQAFARCITKGDPHDPLLRQVLPAAEELAQVPGFTPDPVGDLQAAPVPGLLHKYQGRALLVTTGACAIHCRYCFRRHFPYGQQGGGSDFRRALAYLRENPTVGEVILSGGDPLMLDDARLGKLVEQLDGIDHLRRLRLHTRMPVVEPARVTPELLHSLKTTRLEAVVVVHVNHAAEISAEAEQGLKRLRSANIALLNQSVLLRAINDDAQCLAELSERLFSNGVMPYYLHMLDQVQGAAHFEVPLSRAMRIMADLRRRLPGYLVPRLVREKMGAESKIPCN